MSAKRALVIAVGFPPMGGSGVQRTTKFVKYLPEFGWRAAVVTADPQRDGLNDLDPSLSAEIPEGTAVLRLPYSNPAAKLLKLLPPWGTAAAGTPGASLATPTESPAPGSVGALRRAVRAFKRSVSAPVADMYFYWARRARRPALELARRSGARVIYVSGSPYTSLLLGLWLKERTGLPLVADFRDPWTLFKPEAARGLRFRVNRHFEREVLRGADAIICNHRPMLEDFGRIEPSCREHCEVITNGFDPADFENLPASPSGGDLVHTGYAWEDSPQPMIQALGALRDKGALPGSFRARFLGGLPPTSLRTVGELDLEDVVEVQPRTDHASAITAMRSAGCLLLLLPSSPAGSKWYPAKFFEYMAVGRPVLCVAPRGIAFDLALESGCGAAFEPGDLPGLERALAEIAADPAGWAERNYHPRREVIERFDRRKLTGRLAEILDRVAAKGENVP